MYNLEDAHFWYVGMRSIITSILDRVVFPPHPEILDAGCGTGANLKYLNRYGSTTGVDISPLALKYCVKRGFKNVRQGSIDKLSFQDNTFDLITCFDVLGHARVNEGRALSEFYRVLKPGGLLLLRTPAYPWLSSEHDQIVQNVRRHTRHSIQTLLSGINFLPVRFTYANMFLFPLIALKRILFTVIHYQSNHSDTIAVSPAFNSLLLLPFKIEVFLLNYFNLPFGLSLIVLAHKPCKKYII